MEEEAKIQNLSAQTKSENGRMNAHWDKNTEPIEEEGSTWTGQDKLGGSDKHSARRRRKKERKQDKTQEETTFKIKSGNTLKTTGTDVNCEGGYNLKHLSQVSVSTLSWPWSQPAPVL